MRPKIASWSFVALIAGGLPVARLCGAVTPDAADVIVYTDHIPSLDRNGATLSNPFTETDTRTSTTTRLVIEVVSDPPISYPSGAFPWALATWGKYIFLSNYEEGGAGLSFGGPPVAVADQEIGIFDTETHGSESTRLAADWVREESLEKWLPNAPKVTSGEVIAHKSNGATAVV